MDNTDDEKRKDCDASTCGLGSNEEESKCSLSLSNALFPLQSGQESPSITGGMVLDDGYTWRKYGQKQIMGNSYDSYYRCDHLNCMARKRTRHSGNGHITDCIYTGVHNHAIPELNSIVSVDSVPSAVEQTPHNVGQWGDLIRIELMDSKVCELPESPDCPKLKVLLLQRNLDLMEIPHSFFNHMPLLQHLDLSYTSIRDLPPSVSKLIQLEKFYLKGCDLFLELPPQIGQLKNLQEFDLDGTLITHLPKEIGELINLQSLTLCFDRCYHLLGHDKRISNSTIIPPGVISNLAQLNYLSIDVDPEDERWNENVTNVLMEIFGLGRLMRVSIYVPNADILAWIPTERSWILRLIVGHHRRRFISRVTPEVEEKFKSFPCSMKFVNGENVPSKVKMILRHLEAFYLDRHMTIKSLSVSGLKYLYRLRACILAECNKMETIVNESSDLHDRPALPNLEFLSVFYMKNLRSIYQGSSSPFRLLKSIALHTCPMLTTVFTVDSLENFVFLEEIIIEDCPKVRTLISHDSTTTKPTKRKRFNLPRLRKVSLLYVPELVNIFNGLPVHVHLEEMVIYYCPKLQSLSKWELSSYNSLKMIKGERMWWDALKWDVAHWGHLAPPKTLQTIFSSFNEETDLMTQLVPVPISYKRRTNLPLEAELDAWKRKAENVMKEFEKKARIGEKEKVDHQIKCQLQIKHHPG